MERGEIKRVKALPAQGLARHHFSQIGVNGLGDPLNAYAHSMAWYQGHLYVGSTRSNLCMLKVSKISTSLGQWPVECPDSLYSQDMRSQVWRYSPVTGVWEEVFRAPWITGRNGQRLPREMGYRNMTVFQGRSDREPSLYMATYSPAQGIGTQILRSTDGLDFQPVTKPGDWGDHVTTLRLLVPFKGRLFTAPTGKKDGNPNSIGNALIYETDDPVLGQWRIACTPNFGDDTNAGVFEMLGCGDWLYAATANNKGFQLWRTRAEGTAPYHWERVLVQGAFRGPHNQGVASLCAFDGALYVGTGIQHGGIDVANKIGPASPELIRVHEDGSWELLVGTARQTVHGFKKPLSGYLPGFDNLFTGYFWRMAVHEGWLYLGTFDWSLMLQYADQDKWPDFFRRIVDRVGIDRIMSQQAGADLWRSPDGENWLPVTRNGFDNHYNYGIRTLVSTPHGLAVGTVNPFAPKVALRGEDGWSYQENPRGGMEVWFGRSGGQ
ncbi:hypothetical protein MX652_07180 [Thauera aromatica]|nr:hypothetical protein [Thauera aromatica]MCK2126469.1 hypothetical protein [Thauera aromatica]